MRRSSVITCTPHTWRATCRIHVACASIARPSTTMSSPTSERLLVFRAFNVAVSMPVKRWRNHCWFFCFVCLSRPSPVGSESYLSCMLWYTVTFSPYGTEFDIVLFFAWRLQFEYCSEVGSDTFLEGTFWRVNWTRVFVVILVLQVCYGVLIKRSFSHLLVNDSHFCICVTAPWGRCITYVFLLPADAKERGRLYQTCPGRFLVMDPVYLDRPY